MLSGVTAQIAIKVYGDDLDTLRRTAEQIKAAIADVPGVDAAGRRAAAAGRRAAHPPAAGRPGLLRRQPGLRRRVRADRPARARRSRRCWKASAASTWWCGSTSRTAPTTRNLGRLRIDAARTAGAGRRSASWPTSATATGPNLVNRENVRRRIVIRCNAAGPRPGQRRRRHPAAASTSAVRAAGGLLRRVRRAVREPAAGDAAHRRPGAGCRSSACSSC